MAEDFRNMAYVQDGAMSLPMIAEKFGVTKQAIDQISRRAMERFKRRLLARGYDEESLVAYLNRVQPETVYKPGVDHKGHPNFRARNVRGAVPPPRTGIAPKVTPAMPAHREPFAPSWSTEDDINGIEKMWGEL